MLNAQEDLEKELASHQDRVIVLAGAGVACATDTNPCAYWSGLLKNGLQRCRDRCHNLNSAWANITEQMITQNTADELIQAASRIEKALRGVHDGEYGRWLTDSVGALKLNERRTIDAVLSWGTRIATTNYDNLFEDASGLKAVVWDQGHLGLQVLRGDQPAILHLHGHFLFPNSVVFGARTYQDICRDIQAQNLLRSVLTRDTVVFVGCGAGVDDPNFGGLLDWSRKALENCYHTHYHLVRDSELQAVAKQFQGLRVTPVYGKDYSELGPFLEKVMKRTQGQVRPPGPLETLITQQTDYESQRRELDARTDLLASEYVRQCFDLARSLWNAGGHRTAALHMASTLGKTRSKLSAYDQVIFILEAVEYLLLDNLNYQAMSLIKSAEKLMPDLPPNQTELHSSFRRLLARCLVVNADFDKLEQVIAAALPTAPPQERSRLEVERAEYHMLGGDLAQAELDLGQEGRA